VVDVLSVSAGVGVVVEPLRHEHEPTITPAMKRRLASDRSLRRCFCTSI
jgi:hypothetical protein